uniref:Uncharacterized protein n=1 Tax=Brassica oleracea var. oleracea TaxID=109376 RepID=A0A0D3AYS5_BRAOL
MRLIAALLVVSRRITTLLIVEVGFLLVVVVLKVGLFFVPATIVVDETQLFLTFQTLNLMDNRWCLLTWVTNKVQLLLCGFISKEDVYLIPWGFQLLPRLLIICSAVSVVVSTVDCITLNHVVNQLLCILLSSPQEEPLLAVSSLALYLGRAPR